MVGFYNVSVILTYCGLLSSVTGIFLAMSGHTTLAVVCLMFSGICDIFDGKIARAISRTEDEKRFGIQIDSLSDLVCFGVFPAVLCRALGVTSVVGSVVLALYVLAALIRLAYYNVMEEHRQQETTETRKFFSGLPVTTISFVFPVVYALRKLFPQALPWVLIALMLVFLILFVINFKVIKPDGTLAKILIGLFFALFIVFILLEVKRLWF